MISLVHILLAFLSIFFGVQPEKPRSANSDHSEASVTNDSEANNAVSRERAVYQVSLAGHGVGTSHCGLHALQAISYALGQPIETEELFATPRFLSSPDGSFPSDLREAADTFGLAIRPIKGVTAQELQFLSSPALLQINAHRDGNVKHWIAVMHADSKGVSVYDSAQEISHITPEELNVLWDGSALLVGLTSGDVSSSYWWLKAARIFRLAIWVFIPVAGLLAIDHVRRRLAFLQNGFLLFGSVLLLACLLSLPLLMHVNQGSAVRYARVQAMLDEKPAVDTTDVPYIRDFPGDESPVVIDCRVAADFESGHIPGAVSLPINSGLTRWVRFTEQLDQNRPIVVYCQSAGCGWADITHQRLSCLGFKSKVYSGGYKRYEQEHASNESTQ